MGNRFLDDLLPIRPSLLNSRYKNRVLDLDKYFEGLNLTL